ncbi:MAG: hypothetical protein LBV47_06355 [Bacteroidales bacterium]|nr:hypothetical protein [Bacteroidales bacterium]
MLNCNTLSVSILLAFCRRPVLSKTGCITAHPYGSLSGVPDTMFDPSVMLSGVPDTLPEPSVILSGVPDTLADPSIILSGVPDTLADPSVILSGVPDACLPCRLLTFIYHSS